MFQTQAFFQYYQCPELQKSGKCWRAYCQYYHGSQALIDYKLTNFGFDDFFTNLQPDDIAYASEQQQKEHLSKPSLPSQPQQERILNEKGKGKVSSSSFVSASASASASASDTSKDVTENPPIVSSIKKSGISDNDNNNNNSKQDQNKLTLSDDSSFVGLYKNPRVAHKPTYDLIKNSKTSNRIKSTKQVMLERFSKVYGQYNEHQISATKSFNPVNLKTYSSKSSQISAQTNLGKSKVEIVKTYANVAATNLTFDPLKCIPSSLNETKIPFKVRQRSLKKIFEELIKNNLKNRNQYELFVMAREIEKDVCLKSKNIRNWYANLVAQQVKNVRQNETNPSTCPSETSGGQTIVIKNSKQNFSVIKKTRLTDENLSEEQVFSFLEKICVPASRLSEYGFPKRDAKTGLAAYGNELEFINEYYEGVSLSCGRCGKIYTSPQESTPGVCNHHIGRLYGRTFGLKRYSGCNCPSDSEGCRSSDYHINTFDDFAHTRQGFVETISKPQQKPIACAIDCEMVYTELGLELGRITVLGFDGSVLYDSVVRPKTKIIDYCTLYSGLKEDSFIGVETTLEKVQEKLVEMVSKESIIIGHSLNSDLRALKICHDRVIDTTYLHPHHYGLPYRKSLKRLSWDLLGRSIQTGNEGHDSNEDALAALDIVKHYLKKEITKMTHANDD